MGLRALLALVWLRRSGCDEAMQWLFLAVPLFMCVAERENARLPSREKALYNHFSVIQRRALGSDKETPCVSADEMYRQAAP